MKTHTKGTLLLVAELEELDRHCMAFMRLADGGKTFENLFEVSVPMHFMFFICGPPNSTAHNYFEIARSLGILMSDQVRISKASLATGPHPPRGGEEGKCPPPPPLNPDCGNKMIINCNFIRLHKIFKVVWS